MNALLRLVLIFSLVSAAGCSAPGSSDHGPTSSQAPQGDQGPELFCEGLSRASADGLETHQHCLGEMYPDASAQSFGDGIKVFVALHETLTGDFMVLSGNDRLTATLGSETVELTFDDSSGRVHYVGSFLTAKAGVVTVQLLRDAPLRSATMTLPVAPSFAVTGAPTSIRLGDVVSFAVTPAPASGSVAVYVSGACVLSAKTADRPAALPVVAGTAKFASSDLVVGVSPCDVTTHVREEAGGAVDPRFNGGAAVGLQERSFVASFTP